MGLQPDSVSQEESRKPSRGALRRAAIMAAAREVFLERGFGAATLDEVVRRAGGSRATLYENFGSKEGLFAAIVAEQCDLVVEPLQVVPHARGRPEDVLYAVGKRFLGVLMNAGGLGLYRLVSAEGARFPELAARVFESGPRAAADQLAGYFRSQVKQGTLTLEDPDLAARHFLEMVKGDLHTRALFGVPPPPTDGEIEACVRGAVTIFLRGARTGKFDA
ncbi:MAG: TetR/AcrR family transcriptional regulator [Rhodospirillaceae bacterium]